MYYDNKFLVNMLLIVETSSSVMVSSPDWFPNLLSWDIPHSFFFFSQNLLFQNHPLNSSGQNRLAIMGVAQIVESLSK